MVKVLSERTYEVETHYDVRIPTIDAGITLSADVRLPRGAGRVPALLTVLPYRKDLALALGDKLAWYSARGYATILIDLLGTGSSDGERREEFDPGEGDDAVAAIRWASDQPWCTGAIGMWGMSYMSFLALRAASLCPPGLKAVIAMQGPLDPERDLVHPDGVRGDLHPLGYRGSMMVAQHLFPPLRGYTSLAERRRWQRRLRTLDPVFLDFARHPAGDPAWRERAINLSAITTPTLFVGGWRDKNADAVPRAYEQLRAPKKLIMGPWMHTYPEDSPFHPIDFPPLALRWWDHWLRDCDTGMLDEPPVTLFHQGDRPGWRSYPSWPPTTKPHILRARDRTRLAEEAAPTGEVIAEYEPDPTTGALSGLWGMATPGVGLPVDQHDDDLRAIALTSRPLIEDTLVCGRTEVRVEIDGAAPRLVVRLADVDPQGRSTFIAAGTAGPDATAILLWPTAYRLPAGHRVRIVLSDSDFPRLTPLPHPRVLRLKCLEVTLPVVPPDAGDTADIPVLTAGPPPAYRWTVTRDLASDGIEVTFGGEALPIRTPEGHVFDERGEAHASVRRDAPTAALVCRQHRLHARLSTGEDVTATAVVRCTQTELWAKGELTIDDVSIWSRTWTAPLNTENEDHAP